MDYLTLNNGIKMPQIGLGTFMISPEDAQKTTREALKMGYRLVDTANAYVNERAIGRGIKESGVDRSEVFVSSKLWPSEYTNPNAIDETLERLGLDYIDLLFLHQPSANYFEAYQRIEQAVKDGKVKAIGIANFEGKYIDDILENCEIKPQVIQVEAHPYFTQDELRTVTKPADIKLMSWYPLGHGDSKLMNETIFEELAAKYGKSKAQIILRWHTQIGFIVIPGTKNVDHLRENFDIFDFTLSDEDMANIAKINKNERYYHRSDEQLQQFAEFQPEYEQA